MKDIISASKSIGLQQNVLIRIIDSVTGDVVQEHQGHNCATNSALVGIGHYLTGDGVFNQGHDMLSRYIPQYISLGTMGLYTQDEDVEGLPAGIGVNTSLSEVDNFKRYVAERPGYGADGYDPNQNNNRPYLGIGPLFSDRPDSTKTINCELIDASFPRAKVSFRDIVPETQSEVPKTIDVVFSAMISTGALRTFREIGKDYIFITEAGLWSKPVWESSGENGLIAAYRILPTDEDNWDMENPENRDLLKRSILKVGLNQVVQVIWKFQLGSKDELGGYDPIPVHYENADIVRY